MSKVKDKEQKKREMFCKWAKDQEMEKKGGKDGKGCNAM